MNFEDKNQSFVGTTNSNFLVKVTTRNSYVKEDSNNIIDVLNYVLNEEWQDNKTLSYKNGNIILNCEKNEYKCIFSYFNNDNELKNNGYIMLNANKTIKEFKENEKKIIIR